MPSYVDCPRSESVLAVPSPFFEHHNLLIRAGNGELLGLALKALSDYTNHLTGTRTNKEFADFAWSKPKD